MLDWAGVRGYRSGDNPARWRSHLAEVLPRRSAVAQVEHHPALPYAEIPAFMSELRKREGVAARALELCILCASRSGEVTGARWQEIDFAAKTWTIPGERMKMGKEHRVPLTDRAIKILEGLPREDNNEFVFIGLRPLTRLSSNSMPKLLDRMGHADITVHGFRSTFMDWAHEQTAYPKVVIDMALAHAVGDKVEAAYRRSDLLAKRARLMADWAKYCSSKPTTKSAEVIPLRGATQ